MFLSRRGVVLDLPRVGCAEPRATPCATRASALLALTACQQPRRPRAGNSTSASRRGWRYGRLARSGRSFDGVDTPEDKGFRASQCSTTASRPRRFSSQCCRGSQCESNTTISGATSISARSHTCILSDGTFVNREIVRQGFGHAYLTYPFAYAEDFRAAEREAREAERGLWAQSPAKSRSAPVEPSRVWVNTTLASIIARGRATTATRPVGRWPYMKPASWESRANGQQVARRVRRLPRRLPQRQR